MHVHRYLYITKAKCTTSIAFSVQFLHTSISTTERRPPTNGTVLIVFLKDFRRFSLEFKSSEDCLDIANALDILSHSWMQLYQ